MTPEQREFAKNNAKRSATRSLWKSVRGVKQHGGNLWEKRGMLQNAEDEVADLIQYNGTIRFQLNEVLQLLAEKKYQQAQDKLIDILSEDPN